MLVPVMLISGGCMLFPIGVLPPDTSSTPVIADDPSYDRPPDEVFWKWLPKITRVDPRTGETVFAERSFKLDMQLLTGDLGKHLKDEPSTTAARYFAGLGMSCAPVGPDIRCDHEIAGSFACLYTRRGKLQPVDDATRRAGKLRLAIYLSRDNVVKSALAYVHVTDHQSVCPFKP